MIYFVALLVSAFSTIAVMPLVRALAVRIRAMDVPGARKVHPHTMPKCGGMAMALGALIPVVMWSVPGDLTRSLMIGGAIIVFFGILDDLKDLGYGTKFLGQFAAALVVIAYGGLRIKSLGLPFPDGFVLPEYVAIPLTFAAIVGVTNAINLSDGLDGLAGGICLLIFLTIAYLAYLADEAMICLVASAVIGAIFGFLRFNTYPASLFMGDAGSQLLGFLAVTLAIALTQGHSPYSRFLPLILLGFPILDTLTVMTERIYKGQSPFRADTKHFHHKLMKLGFFHTEAVLIIYVIQALLVTTAVVLRYGYEWSLLLGYLAFSGVILSIFKMAANKGWRFERQSYFDTHIKWNLRKLKGRRLGIRLFSSLSLFGVPLILVLSCLLVKEMPQVFTVPAAVVLFLTVSVWLAKREWMPLFLRIAFYGLVPFLIYLADANRGAVADGVKVIYNLAFGLLAVAAIFMLKLSEKENRFRTTPLDFLILFIALIVPIVPGGDAAGHQMGFIATKIIVLFFAFEVLLTEFQGKVEPFGGSIIAALGVVTLKGLIG
jgi:UDP-GlcNAc:undecaprenyl-phosphate/decaprenyl-phosphate GlcNAc-1-phosphate transferase